MGAGGSRKRKANNSDDSDFDAAPKTKKAAAQKPAPGGMLSYLVEKDKVKKTAKPKAQTATQKYAQNALDTDMFGQNKKKEEPEAEANTYDVWQDIENLDGVPEASKAAKKAPAPFKKPAAQKKLVLSDDGR